MATEDLITTAEAKTALNIGAAVTTYDTRIALIVTAVSERIVEMCGPVVNVTRTDEVYDGGVGDVALRGVAWSRTVTTTISAVKEYDSTGALTTLTAEDFDTKPADGYLYVGEEATLRRRYSGGPAAFTAGYRNVLVTYTTGRAANTAAVPAKFKLAALICVNHVWSNLGAMSGAARAGSVDGLAFSIPPWGIPKAALDYLHGEFIDVGVG